LINIQCDFRAKSLYMPTTITVLLPTFFDHARTVESLDEIYKEKDIKYKTLFLLHGAFENARGWLAYTNIEKYANKHKLAVVLPSVGNSFYANMAHGPAYWNFLSDELIRFVRTVFPLSDKREDNYVAGLSMGGYGAFKLALNKPDQFAAAISLSGAVDIVSLFKESKENLFSLEDIFGSMEKLEGSENDLFALMKKNKNDGNNLPRLYLACGLEDSLYNSNQKFRQFAKSQSIEVTYEEGPGGHDWDFWDLYIQRSIEWLGIN
jgi:putative tributyrin esterase